MFNVLVNALNWCIVRKLKLMENWANPDGMLQNVCIARKMCIYVFSHFVYKRFFNEAIHCKVLRVYVNIRV